MGITVFFVTPRLRRGDTRTLKITFFYIFTPFSLKKVKKGVTFEKKICYNIVWMIVKRTVTEDVKGNSYFGVSKNYEQQKKISLHQN